jgi:hypothetical protein
MPRGPLYSRSKSLFSPSSRIQADLGAALVCEQPDAVELPLEQPVVAGEAFLRQRGGDRFEPI